MQLPHTEQAHQALPVTDHLVKKTFNAILEPNSEVLVVPEVQAYSRDQMRVQIGSANCLVNKSIWTAAGEVDTRAHGLVAGFGTGGAVALCAAVRDAEAHAHCPTVVSFGSPPVGGIEFAHIAACIHHIRVRLSSDPISTQIFGLYQHGNEVVIGRSSRSLVDILQSRICAELGSFESAHPLRTYAQQIQSCHADELWVSVDI